MSSQLAAAMGTAVVAVALAGSLSGRIPGAEAGRGLAAAQRLADEGIGRYAAPLVDAFQTAYLVGLGLMAAAILPAFVLGRIRSAQVTASSRPGTAARRVTTSAGATATPQAGRAPASSSSEPQAACSKVRARSTSEAG